MVIFHRYVSLPEGKHDFKKKCEVDDKMGSPHFFGKLHIFVKSISQSSDFRTDCGHHGIGEISPL